MKVGREDIIMFGKPVLALALCGLASMATVTPRASAHTMSVTTYIEIRVVTTPRNTNHVNHVIQVNDPGLVTAQSATLSSVNSLSTSSSLPSADASLTADQTLSSDTTLPAGTVLVATQELPAGTLLANGNVLPATVTLQGPVKLQNPIRVPAGTILLTGTAFPINEIILGAETL